ncbi:MAG: hypothetical protein AVDCRST_MAG43-1485 [uncultured Thermomicrobiales bacterium]|uniref:DUF2779 domain-containing protein n=1 Tax=uncultured Thermomicrobiales bacterium TaxID=1645740 RepID=A0A6J4UNY9_9BACT|nr:MAG: hypothetical protein AVDCRST_MAG43-1485 [uncultured Thermomicrobiales bacterium]
MGDRAFLSKSDFLNFRICPGFCWIAKHQPHRIPLNTDPGTRRRIDDGDAVEALARQRFPDATLIATLDPEDAVRQTEAAIAAGATTLFQAAVLTEHGLFARADVLTRDGDGWRMFEIKASTSVTAEHRADATFQAIAFMEAGYDIRRIGVLHLDRNYRLSGSPDPVTMFVVSDVTESVDRALVPVMEQIEGALAAVRDPSALPACQCDRETRKRRCPAFALFHPHIPAGGTIYDLTAIHHRDLIQVLDRGILALADWPDDVPLSRRQHLQVETHRTGEPWVAVTQLRKFIGRLRFPLYFLDYETCQTAIPLYDGYTPWAQVPFQYSLHIVTADGAIEHREFLWTEPRDFPVPHLVKQLRRDIGDDGSVVVWSRNFEADRQREMAEALPDEAGFLLGLNGRMVDLMEPVASGAWMHPDFGGSASIKKVLPAVDPELSYEALRIGNGGLAAERWHQAMVNSAEALTAAEREAIFSDLREYCHLDTLAMVRIWEHLRDLVR